MYNSVIGFHLYSIIMHVERRIWIFEFPALLIDLYIVTNNSVQPTRSRTKKGKSVRLFSNTHILELYIEMAHGVCMMI
mgnify:CR=1 FL=1